MILHLLEHIVLNHLLIVVALLFLPVLLVLLEVSP